MAIRLVSHTTPHEEDIIERTATQMGKRGFGTCLVNRNRVDVALATIALAKIKLSSSFNEAVGGNGKYSIIGFRSFDDDKKIRDCMDELRTLTGFCK